MQCASCQSAIDEDAEACFTCGQAVFALTQGAVLSGRYQILQPLGRGGMGRVYKAFDRIMEEHVAVKVLRTEFMRDPEMSRRFVSEIKLARKIGHRNVCRIHEYGEDGDVRFIVMELIDGVTLKEYLRAGPLPPDAAYDVSIQVARGLNAVHELGIVHRDFKAANIMIDRQGVAKLVDFGIAKDLSSELTGPTVAGMLMGTPEYMSPEQVQGGPVGYRSDIYALGCVVYEMFTGHAPFRGATPVATVFMHVNEDLPVEGEDAARIPPALLPVLQRALAKDPRKRFSDVSEFAEALSAACSAGGFATPVHRGGLRLPLPPSSPAASTAAGETSTIHVPRRRLMRRLALAFLVLVALAGALAYRAMFGPAPSALPPPSTIAAVDPSPILAPSAPAADAAPLLPSPLVPSLAPALTAPTTLAPLVPRAAPPATAPAPAPAGILRLLIVPPSAVLIDGRDMGTVSRREVSLVPGPHAIRVEHPDYQPLQRRVTIRDGEEESLVIDLAEKGIRRQ